MSTTIFQQAVDNFDCPYCKQRKGHACRKRGTASVVVGTHKARLALADSALSVALKQLLP